MAPDRSTKVVLVALTIGVWALALAYAGTPAGLARASDDAAIGDAALQPVSEEEVVAAAPFATYPLRWYVSLVHHEVIGGSVTCKTIAFVVNLHSASVNVELEFYDELGALRATRSSSIPAAGLYYVGTDQLTGAGEYPQTGDWLIPGHGRVYADHPMIIASNYVECPTGANSITSYPVGATLDFIQASLPVTEGLPRYADIVEGTQSR